MRRGNLIVLLIAIVMGGMAAFMARSWLQRQTVEQPTNATIVIAAEPLKFGTTLTKENVKEIPWSGPTIPAAFATTEELFKDGRRAVLAPLERNEPVLRAKVTGPGQRASLSSLLEEGKRAVTVRVDDVKGVAGFVLPADRVDVVLIRTETRQPASTTETYSDVLVEHVKVLAVDQLANERQEQPTVAKAVTLEVTTEQAQKILLASNIGKISLILRQAGEANSSRARRVSEGDLGLQEIREEAPVPTAVTEAAPVPQGGTAVVEIVRGVKGQKYEVKRVHGDDSLPASRVELQPSQKPL
jgi:pilus assembly protein CpaB